MYTALQIPYTDERTLRSYLARLAVTVEVQAQNQPLNSEGPPSVETIFSKPIQDIDDPIIVVQTPDKNDASSKDGHLLLIWKVSAMHVERPRMRLAAGTNVVLFASATLKPAHEVQPDARKDEYLPSLIPSGINLLESFGQDPMMAGNNKPRLSALRVSRVIPTTSVGRDLMRPFKNICRRSFRAFPVIGTRIKYCRPNIKPNSQLMIATLDVDILPVSGCDIILDDIEIKMLDGTIEDLNNLHGTKFPVKCLPLDNLTFLYRLSPKESAGDMSVKSNLRTLDMTIKVSAVVTENCKAHIVMNWKTSVDFTIPVNPGYGQPSQNLQRTRRPANLSIDSFDSTHSNVTLRSDLPSLEPTHIHKRISSVPDFGITITLSGPDCVTPGEPFIWNAFVVNRSNKPRKLALIVVPKRRRGEPRSNRPPTIGPESDIFADAYIDEHIVHVVQKNATLDSADIICLSTDLRVGPLAPSACHAVDVKMLTYTTGVVALEAVRVVDMGTNEHVDIHDIPTIVSVPKESTAS